jgi:hypothetical protein
MQHGRGLFSGSTNRALYSGVTGRALYNPLDWSRYYQVDGTHLQTFFDYTITKSDPRSKDDVWPEIKNHQSDSWISGFSGALQAETQWFLEDTPDKVVGDAKAGASVFDVSSLSGTKCHGIRFTVTQLTAPTGCGIAYASVQTQSTTTPTVGYSWIEGTERVAITGTGTVEFIFGSAITLSNYLFLVAYFKDLEPPTTAAELALLKIDTRNPPYASGIDLFVTQAT